MHEPAHFNLETWNEMGIKVQITILQRKLLQRCMTPVSLCLADVKNTFDQVNIQKAAGPHRNPELTDFCFMCIFNTSFKSWTSTYLLSSPYLPLCWKKQRELSQRLSPSATNPYYNEILWEAGAGIHEKLHSRHCRSSAVWNPPLQQIY